MHEGDPHARAAGRDRGRGVLELYIRVYWVGAKAHGLCIWAGGRVARREERPQHALRSLCAMNRLRSDVVRPSDRGGWWVVVVLGFLWNTGYGCGGPVREAF